MLKLWGRINSINVQKVLWTLAELNVAYERPRADDRGRRVRVVGIERNRAVSLGEARRGHALAERSPATRRRRPLDGLDDEHRRTRAHARLLGPYPHGSRKTQHGVDRSR